MRCQEREWFDHDETLDCATPWRCGCGTREKRQRVAAVQNASRQRTRVCNPSGFGVRQSSGALPSKCAATRATACGCNCPGNIFDAQAPMLVHASECRARIPANGLPDRNAQHRTWLFANRRLQVKEPQVEQ